MFVHTCVCVCFIIGILNKKTNCKLYQCWRETDLLNVFINNICFDKWLINTDPARKNGLQLVATAIFRFDLWLWLYYERFYTRSLYSFQDSVVSNNNSSTWILRYFQRLSGQYRRDVEFKQKVLYDNVTYC